MAKINAADITFTLSRRAGEPLRLPLSMHIGSRVRFVAAPLPKSVRGRIGFRIADRGRVLPRWLEERLAATLGDVQTHANGQLSLPV